MATRKKKRRGEFPPPPPNKPYQCEFCGTSFTREKSLINHTCKYKIRWLWRDNRDYKLAFLVYETFYSTQQHSKVSYDDFMYSDYFDAFVRFSKYIIDNKIVEPKKFIDFVIKNQLKLDQWATDATYELYIRSYVENELPYAAMARNIEIMRQWAEESGNHWTEFFEKVSPGWAVQLVKLGRLSPWVLYTLDSANVLLARLSPEQLKLVTEQYAPLSKWKVKFTIKKDEVCEVREIFGKAGL